MRCLTNHSWVFICLCSLLFSGCAVNQGALFSVAPEMNQCKIDAIAQSATVRQKYANNKTTERAKPDHFRVTGFNKASLKRQKTVKKEAVSQVAAKIAPENDLEFDEFADFHAIELAEYNLRQKAEIQTDSPVEARKPVIQALPPIPEPVIVSENITPETEVAFRTNTELQVKQEAVPETKSAELVELGLKPLSQLSISAKPPTGELPKNTAAEHLDKFPTRHVVMGDSRDWELATKEWEAPGTSYNPLYFEEPNLERYGYNYGAIQPFVSAGRFFGRVAILPYMIGAYPLHETRYPLGYARPGDDPLYQVEKLPFSARGAVFEGLTATGLVFLIP